MLKNVLDSDNQAIKSVIRLIKEKGPLSRVDISKQLNISKPTLTRIIEKLMEADILKEKGLAVSTGGRRPILLQFNEDCSYAIGVELGRSEIKLALTNLIGRCLFYSTATAASNSSLTTISKLVKTLMKEAINETNVNPAYILGVGVGMPGPFNEKPDGTISPPNFYGLREIALKEKLEQELHYPVTIDNDANIAALAEKWFGAGVDSSCFAFVMADVGVGTGLVVNHDLYRGENGEAGEIGHSTIDVNGERCVCGNVGCLETFVSIPAILKKLKNRLDDERTDLFAEELSLESIPKAHRNHSLLAKEILEETGFYLGVGITNVINLYNPEKIIIGGKVGKLHPLIRETIRNPVNERVIGSNGKRTPIVTSTLKGGVVQGAAALVIHHTFFQ
ncbi:ROK family transcriptional regulator [Halobacillus salinarum]|uniref:ROK family transcriptional regulator n=1 Tax=Halobacillus salinarum TaxID=2932257 RepID=A0ABY4EIG1_9BACI|nr:ROK family transcriptional regulator [Halobacillus salinarum]UOQ44260.1 ROK family transcriptional regulator [Halobacillus salinarum]